MQTRHLLSSFPCSVTTSLAPRRNHPKNFTPRPTTQNPSFSPAHLIRCCSTKRSPPRRRSSSGGPYWDSNAETLRTEQFKFNFGDESIEDDAAAAADDDDDADIRFRRRKKQQRNWWSEDDSPDIDQGSGILEEAIDSIWIIKVFRSFGWMLPAIIISTLLATGPKAFLMALAIPLGQSALSFAIDKLFGRNNPKPRSRTKKKPFARATSNVEMSEEEQEEESSGIGKGKGGYQSWVAADGGSAEKKGDQRGPSFGGWDELDRRGESVKRSTRRPPHTTGEPARSKLSRRGRNRDTPLLLRLLIAVFPFLGSWTKLL